MTFVVVNAEACEREKHQEKTTYMVSVRQRHCHAMTLRIPPMTDWTPVGLAIFEMA